VDALICTAPFTTLEVTDLGGRLHQCDRSWTFGDRGSLEDGSLLELWNGPGYRAARRAMIDRAHDRLCRPICPRLRDGRYAEHTLRARTGSPAFTENLHLLLDDVAARREVVRARPIKMSLCPSSYCNYDCVMCDYGRTPRRDLPDRIWDELPALLPTLSELNLHGGEPLASGEVMRFLREVDCDRYPDLRINLVTNGSLLTERALAHLGRCAFGEITVSLNAGTAEAYARVQRGTIDLAGVLANVDALCRLRDAHKKGFRVTLGFVVQPVSASTLLDFAQIARARGLPIQLRPLAPESPDALGERFYSDPDAVNEVLAALDRLKAHASEPDWVRQADSIGQAIIAQAGAGVRRLPLVS
jgi:molybdenum cofactor biosynthesis enzyme MoaA